MLQACLECDVMTVRLQLTWAAEAASQAAAQVGCCACRATSQGGSQTTSSAGGGHRGAVAGCQWVCWRRGEVLCTPHCLVTSCDFQRLRRDQGC